MTRIQYWNSRMSGRDERQIHTIQLCGGSANMRGLTSYIEEQTSIKTVRADVWTTGHSQEQWVPEIDKRHSYGYATAIGLALASHV